MIISELEPHYSNQIKLEYWKQKKENLLSAQLILIENCVGSEETFVKVKNHLAEINKHIERLKNE